MPCLTPPPPPDGAGNDLIPQQRLPGLREGEPMRLVPCPSLSGARLLFGGKPLEGHAIPDVYGALHPTAVFVPLDQILRDENWDLVNTEVFGPFQVRPPPRGGPCPEETSEPACCTVCDLSITETDRTSSFL
jgi:hypothetical protein